MSAHEAGFEPQPPHGTSFPLHLIRDTPLIRGTTAQKNRRDIRWTYAATSGGAS
jgi:hypothetical protein